MTHYLYLTKYNSSNLAASARLEISNHSIEQPRSKLLNHWRHPMGYPLLSSTLSIPESLTAAQATSSSTKWMSPFTSELFPLSSIPSNPVEYIPNSISQTDDSCSVCQSSGFVEDDWCPGDDDGASTQSFSKVSSSSDCSMCYDLYSSGDCDQLFSPSLDVPELAKRCQQCREIIIAAKVKQESEARKNANCLLEQIEQEEEERANREAMQARKRERKRMKRKAKQQKGRLEKETIPPEVASCSTLDEKPHGHGNSPSRITSPVVENDIADLSSNENSPTLSRVVRHMRKVSFSSQRSNDSLNDNGYNQVSSDPQSAVFHLANTDRSNKIYDARQNNHRQATLSMPYVSSNSMPCTTDSSDNFSQYSRTLESPSIQPHSLSDSSACSTTVSTVLDSLSISATGTQQANSTEVKREKHRNKKQSQRAAKRAAVGNGYISDATDKTDRQTIPNYLDPVNPTMPVTSIYYNISPNGDSEVNWSALIESQSAQFDQYITNGLGVVSTESSNWTVVVPGGSSRTQRSTGTATSTRSNVDTADWKTNSNSGFFKRRLSIPVSRHDIGKVIGQGGAVVSALRNMSGIQIDIESARSDEVTERMVFLKGPNESVMRTYETIQGLLTGLIAGNDVLLMYAALKESTTTASSTAGKAMLTALNSKTSGPITLTVSSGATKTSTSTGRSSAVHKTLRKMGKSTTSSSSVNSNVSTRSVVSSGNVLTLNRNAGLVSKTNSATSAPSNNNNSNCSVAPTGIIASNSATFTTKTSTGGTPSWSSKLLIGSSSRGNFASVAAAGLATQSLRPVGEKSKTNVQTTGKYSAVPNLMSTMAPTPTSSRPVSLLSLNLAPFSTSSSMFSDLGLSYPPTNDVPDSLDEMSFPPLNSSSKNVHPATQNPTTENEPSRLSPVPSVSNVATSNSYDSESIDTVSNFTSVDATVIHNYPSLTTSGTNISNISNPSLVFNPLTISPPTITSSRSSQPHTPVGSGDILPSVSMNTPTITQTKSFPLAPGSERSAHHRNANVSSISAVSSGDTYPSLTSLDMGVKLSNTGVSCVDGALLLTPMKRAISPEVNDPEFHQHSVRTRFRPDTNAEWCGAELTANTCPTFTTSSSFGFSVQPSNELMPANVSTLHQSILGSPASTSAPNTGSSRVQLPQPDVSRRPVISSITWPFQAADINPNMMSYPQSAFQPPSGPTIHQSLVSATTNLSVDSAAPTASIQMEYPDLSTSTALPGGYLLKSQLGAVRNAISKHGASLTPISKPPVSVSQLMNLNTHGVPTTTDLLSTTFSQNTIPAAIRHKAFLSGLSNMYTESRSSVLNGFSNSVDPNQQLSRPATGMQVPSLFPRVAQPQHTAAGTNSFTTLTHQQQSNTTALSSRFGSSHPLLTPAQMNQLNCQPVSINSYTPPPYLSSFVQSGSATGQTGAHTGTYPTHLLNGPVFGNGSLMGTSGGSLNASTPAPIQPIGAERRRQTVSTSTAPSSLIFPSTVSNGPGSLGAFSVANMSINSHPPNISPQQTSTSSTANNMLMALTMNWMQQQQQQLALNQAGSPNPPTNWQPPPSMWPTNTAVASFPSGTGSVPPVKIPHSGLPDPSTYGNTGLLPSNLTAGGASSGQQQQSMVAAAMAAMANIYPWNNSNAVSAASGQVNTMSTPSVVAGTGQPRWMYPSHFGSAYSNTTSNPNNAYFSDQLPPNIKSAGNTAAPSSIHRPSHE